MSTPYTKLPPGDKNPSAPSTRESRPQVYYSSVHDGFDRQGHPHVPPNASYAANAAPTAPSGPQGSAPPSGPQNHPQNAQSVPLMDNDYDELDEPICRLCYEGEKKRKDPLIVPCRCSGSMKYVHRSCLDSWRSMSPKSQSFYTCDQCQVDYDLLVLSDKVSNWRYLKYAIFVFLDMAVFFTLWQVAVLICSGIYWLIDALAADGWTEKHVIPELPTPINYYFYGICFFFFILGLIGIVLVLFYGLRSICRRGRSRSSSNHNSAPVGHYGPTYYRHDPFFNDWFIFWILFSRPHFGFYGPPVHHGGCNCCTAPLFFNDCGPCDIGHCHSCDNLNCSNSSDGAGAALLAVVAVIVIIIIAIGIIFGTVATILFAMSVTQRHYVILQRKDLSKTMIVRDLNNEANNNVVVNKA